MTTTATNERPQQDWYWCDTCQDSFYGNASIIHKGRRCYYVKEPDAPIGTLVVERGQGLDLYRDGLWSLDQCFLGVLAHRTIDMTVNNRGAVVRLRRNERLVWTPQRGDQLTWYGMDVREVTLRVWHDASVTVEHEVDR